MESQKSEDMNHVSWDHRGAAINQETGHGEKVGFTPGRRYYLKWIMR